MVAMKKANRMGRMKSAAYLIPPTTITRAAKIKIILDPSADFADFSNTLPDFSFFIGAF